MKAKYTDGTLTIQVSGATKEDLERIGFKHVDAPDPLFDTEPIKIEKMPELSFFQGPEVRERLTMKQIKQDAYVEEVENHQGPVLLDFSATWCGPCRMLTPTLERLSAQYIGRIKFLKLDIEECGDAVAKFGIHSVPCLVLIRNGKEVGRLVGNQPESALKNWFQGNGI